MFTVHRQLAGHQQYFLGQLPRRIILLDLVRRRDMSGIVLLSVLGVVSAGFYVAYLKFSSYGSDDDDIERDGGDSTKIRHERGI